MSATQGAQILDVDAATLAEQHHEDGQANGRLRRRHGKNEKHEYLAVDLAEETREGHEVKIGRQQQQLDAHQQQQHVAPVYEDSGDREGEQDGGQPQHVAETDHGGGSAAILTIRTRSPARTATCAAMFWDFSPLRCRNVNEMAAMIATSS